MQSQRKQTPVKKSKRTVEQFSLPNPGAPSHLSPPPRMEDKGHRAAKKMRVRALRNASTYPEDAINIEAYPSESDLIG
jgi:hypothetical protein